MDGTVEVTANKDTDTSLTADSDIKYPSQKAVKAYVDNSATGKVSKSGDTMTGKLKLAPWTELSGESPDGWPLIPFDPSDGHQVPIGFTDDTCGGYDYVMWQHRGHVMIGLTDATNALGFGAGYVIPTMTIGSPAVNGITFPTAWRFNNDPVAQGSTFHPYDSGITNGKGTGMHLTADFTSSAFSNNVKIFDWSPSGLTAVKAVLVDGSADEVQLTISAHSTQTNKLVRFTDSSNTNLIDVSGTGVIEFGSSSDTNLYRSAADTLKTDDNLIVAAAGTAVNSAVNIDATQTLSNKRITPRATTITSSATPTINTDNCDAVTITAQAADITSMTTNLSGTPNNFDKLIIRIKDDSTPRAITWGASFVSEGATLPTTTTASKVTTVGLIYDSVKAAWGCVAAVTEA